MDTRKSAIYAAVNAMRRRRAEAEKTLTDAVSLDEYRALVRSTGEGEIWTDALQKALDEHEIVRIPAREEAYYIDRTVTVPSNRRIEAEGATIRLTRDCTVLMLRNVHTKDGTHAPVDTSDADENITVRGGRWEEQNTARAGYGRTGKYDAERSFYGVSTLFLFNNIRGLTLENLTFYHTAGFSVQTGDLTDGVFDRIRFEACFADGLHLNGRSENLYIHDIRGEVGDDLVALNMYDWQNSSVNFGPTRNVVCEDMELAKTSHYRALRIEPGMYAYDDGSKIDCGLFGAVFKNIRGISTYKLYYQTPAYPISGAPEPGDVGSADDLYFEDLVIDLSAPIDGFDEYLHGDPVRGAFGAFELGANIGHITFQNIDLIRYDKRFPNSHLVVCGPKSVRCGDVEVFDPYLSSTVDSIVFRGIRVNGYPAEDIRTLLRVVSFEDINQDGRSTAAGTVRRIVWDDVVCHVR